MSEYDLDEGLSERVEAEKPGASSLPLARTPRSENPPRLDGGEIGAEPVARRVEPQQPARRKSKRASHVSPPSSRGKCTAHAPAGTRCKLCGQVHPQREGKSVKIHVPGPGLEAKEDFK